MIETLKFTLSLMQQ